MEIIATAIIFTIIGVAVGCIAGAVGRDSLKTEYYNMGFDDGVDFVVGETSRMVDRLADTKETGEG
jgi:hypothetical protein